MRSILALSLLITLCGSANAATVHHAHRRHAIMTPQTPLRVLPTRHLGRRSTTGPNRTMITMNRIRELPRVTHLANKNNFSTV